ncbi:2-C-methyl-D-erythritol 4-phosphate cytidylyltransferase [Cohnella lubricantis]|uniref:2-C-methyl-D-erythritol 4-phosphate cytidylyltransferase n=1 Tax=Cohnella lubricantis TaxID=2163172 RepID=A0A841TK05_9BACL|nr:2-C-methyl-D-erythritol 4-phosphate cytidylyltransferase [Cohnella lubricantis]MBB6679267.1 2-C-methyl-D-erythritol 4-phosphate cytidylyltransferase [Cohnella lubricantis]MBP2119597.1 2-C-methyl-D-erythritol 4-phosphate cytidylyltransferase [Cohnella lubricantis]
MKWGAVVVAAGRGTRMGASDNKPYLTLAGRPVLAYALEAFGSSPSVESIVLVVAPGEEAKAKAVVQELEPALRKVKTIVPGGAERQDSVYAGLAALDTEGVLVHDAARPLVTPEQIEACCREAERHGASALAVPVKDTIKVEGERGFMTATPDRSTLWAVQTPQAFAREELLNAHRAAKLEGAAATDDTMLLERMGRKVAIVRGDYLNLKITTPEDLPVAELLLEKRSRASLDARRLEEAD